MYSFLEKHKPGLNNYNSKEGPLVLASGLASVLSNQFKHFITFITFAELDSSVPRGLMKLSIELITTEGLI